MGFIFRFFFSIFSPGKTHQGRGISFEEACDKAKAKSGKTGDVWFKVEESWVKVHGPITEYYVLLSETGGDPPT